MKNSFKIKVSCTGAPDGSVVWTNDDFLPPELIDIRKEVNIALKEVENQAVRNSFVELIITVDYEYDV